MSIQNVSGRQATELICKLAGHARTALMMTDLEKSPFSVRPMAIQKVDKNGQMYFFSARSSGKNQQLASPLSGSQMHICIANDGDSEYLSLSGQAEVYRNQQEIDEMYTPLANNWFSGKDDPELTIIRFTPSSGHYWDTKHGKMIAFASMIAGAVTGRHSDDGVEGDIAASAG
jgi:general stress protein 26